MQEELKELFASAIEGGGLRKIVFSRPVDKTIRRAEGKLISMKSGTFLQIERFHTDGKATHENIPVKSAAERAASLAEESFRQTNLLTAAGDSEILVSAKGKVTIRRSKASVAAVLAPAAHDKEKHYLLADESAYRFLHKLDVCDEQGHIYERRQAKYRQINRFLEILDDVYPKLPGEGELTVCDLCCGKSYLTFAVYYYLTQMKGRAVRMYGVDRKADVMDYCARVAKDLGFAGMSFYAMNIEDFAPENEPQLVISLHACDIATDIVLANAVRLGAEVILSTPCCHHEMMRQLDCPTLSFLEEHSILKQKFCDAATDALRAKRLEAEGYAVHVMELIDPEETPKNALIKAIRRKNPTAKEKESALRQYKEAVALLGIDPTLNRLLK